MNNITDKSKYKIKIFIIIYFIALIICLPYLLPHKITDTYWNIGEGIEVYKYTPLKDGRIIHFLILSVMDFLNIKMEFYTIAVHYICTIIYALSIYNVFSYIMKLLKSKIEQSKNSKILKGIILISSVLIILNPLTVENFAYIENLIMSLSILIGTIAARILHENKKGSYLKTLLLIILAGLCYQGNLNIWIGLSILYFAIDGKKTIKEWIQYFFKIGTIAIVVLISLVAIINITNLVIGNEQSRLGVSEHNLKEILSLFLIFFIKPITDVTFGYYPTMLIIVTISITTLSITYCEMKNPIKHLAKYYFLLIAVILSCILPAFLQKDISLSARMVNGIGAIIGISFIYMCYIIVEKENKKATIILLILSIIILCINLFDYYNVAYMNHVTMKEEQKYINQINEVMLEYEKENNIKLTKVMFFWDSNYTDTYNSLPKNTFNSRAIVAIYSKIYCLNYYTRRSLKEEIPTKEKYNKYFKDKDWNEFNKDQVQFEGDTVYICVY